MKKRRRRAGEDRIAEPRRRGAEAREDAVLDGLTVLSGYITLLGQAGPLTARQRDMLERLDRTTRVLIDLLLPAAATGSDRED